VQTRARKFHRQIGIVEDVLAAGVGIDRLGLRTTAGLVATPDLGSFGEGVTAIPYRASRGIAR
jgi:hypothetical protein